MCTSDEATKKQTGAGSKGGKASITANMENGATVMTRLAKEEMKAADGNTQRCTGEFGRHSISGFGSSLPPEVKARIEAKKKSIRPGLIGLQREKLDGGMGSSYFALDMEWEKKVSMPTPRGLQREKLRSDVAGGALKER